MRELIQYIIIISLTFLPMCLYFGMTDKGDK